MGSIKKPASLRSSAARPALARGTEATSAGVAAACVVALGTSVALAQSPGTGTQSSGGSPGAGTLPPLKVETAAKRRAAPAAKAAPKRAPAPPAPAQVEAAPATGAAGGLAAPDANPYANPAAPYNVQRSGSPQLTQPLVDTPRTVTAIPKEVIEDKGATSLQELARQTPGVVLGFAEGGNAVGDAIYIRGFSARGDIYVDSLRDPGNVAREVFAAEQIEIYKGPTGVIGGRGTAGGAINFITKKPNEYSSFFNSSTMIGTDSTFRQTFDVNQVVTPWFAVRGNVMYNTNEVAGRDHVENERWGGLLSATLKPTQAFKLTLDYYRFRSDGLPDWGVPINPGTKLPWPESGLRRSNWYGNAVRDFIRGESDILTATVEAKLADNVKLTSRSRMGENVTDYVASSPGATAASPITPGSPNRYQETDMLANQTDLTVKFMTGSWQHTVVAGVEFEHDTVNRMAYTNLSQVPTSLFNPIAYRGNNNVGGRALTFQATLDTQAAYISDTIKFNEQWSVNGGVRVDRFKRDQVGGAGTATTAAAAAANSLANTASREDTLTNWHAGIVFKPTPISSIYFAYATATNPIGGELDANGITYGGLQANIATLQPEQTTAYEIGTKWELFDKRLLATAALFQTDKQNARENSSTAANQLVSTGAYRARGVELGVQGNITNAWSVFGGVVVMDTEVTESGFPEQVGRRLANVPLQQFALLSKYKLTDNLTVGGQAIYSSEVYSGFFAANGFAYHTVPYWRFDALAEYKLTKNLTAQLNVINITDAVYYDALYQSQGSFAFVAPGRAAYLTLNVKY